MSMATGRYRAAKMVLTLSIGVSVAATPIIGSSANFERYTSSGANISSPQELLAWQEKVSRTGAHDAESLIAQDIRLQAMYDFAKKIAIRAAMTSRLDEIQTVVQGHSRELDSIYNFSPLMIQQRVVPPVITEARNLYNQDGRNQIRLSDAIYNIESQAYFSSTPPNWRSYLKFSNEGSAYSKLSYAAGGMQPKNSIEEQIWEEATQRGWALGLAQSNVVLEQAMLRLNKDYIGMIKFHTMVLSGQITMPSINSYNLYDNNQGNRLILGEELLQIDVLPQFKNPTTGPGARLHNTLMNELSMDGVSIKAPLSLTERPIKEVYDISERIRNGIDVTEKPWADSMELARSVNPLLKEPNLDVHVYRTHKLADPITTSAPEEVVSNDEYLDKVEIIQGAEVEQHPERRYSDIDSYFHKDSLNHAEKRSFEKSLTNHANPVDVLFNNSEQNENFQSSASLGATTTIPLPSNVIEDGNYDVVDSVINQYEQDEINHATPLISASSTIPLPPTSIEKHDLDASQNPEAELNLNFVRFGTEIPEQTRQAYTEMNNR